MPFTYKFQINMTLLGNRIALSTELDPGEASEKQDAEAAKKLGTKYYTGNTIDLNLSVTDLIEDLLNKIHRKSDDKPVIPEGLLPDLTLKDVYVSYNGSTKALNIIALASIASYEVKFFFHKGGEGGEYAFGIQADVGSMEGLPMVGEQLKDMELSNVGFVYSSKAGKFQMPRLSNIIEEGFGESRRIDKKGIEQEYQKGFHLVGDLFLPNTAKPVALILPVSKKQQKETDPETPTAPDKADANGDKAAAPEAALNPATKWFQLDKTVGPLTVGALGFSYRQGKLSLLFRGSIKLAGLTVSLNGLGVGLNPSALFSGKFDAEKDLSFYLDGLGLSYVKDPINLGGAFLRTYNEKAIFSFAGAAIIKIKKFSITGIGEYALLKPEKEGEKPKSSLFLFAILDAPIGGPAFFFVTGIAAGFGYNRRVRIPDIKEVHEFPFVSLAISPPGKPKTLDDILTELTTSDPPWVPISVGDYWLAIGIKFTSFKLFESFILLIVQFGNRLSFAILGLTVLKWPDDTFGDSVKPLIYVELALKISFGPGSDVISVEAVITPNSYVFIETVRITGGFAFYTWISGPNEGDFVITLGGYHPKYKTPDYYPEVDRLGLYVKIPGVPVTMSGELYFALTPNAIMAGGRWEIAYDIGFLKAYLIIWADILIQWAPFYYEISAGVRIGIEANILFIRFKLEMGAELRIWGPPFAGEIFVDWKIFSFTIPFGDTKKGGPPPLKWEEFRDTMVPKVNEETQPLETKIQSGVANIIRNKEDKEKIDAIIVDPYNLAVAVDSFFPLKQVFLASTEDNELDDKTLTNLSDSDAPRYFEEVKDKSFGIKPMAQTDLDSKLHVWLEKGNIPINENITRMGNAKGVPSALWSNKSEVDEEGKDKEGVDQERVLSATLSGVELHTTEPLDDSIIFVKIVDYDKEKFTKKAEYFKNISASSGLKYPDGVRRDIVSNINKPVQETIIDSLKSLGFDLEDTDTLDFDALHVHTPYFSALIGQKIPEKIKD